MQQGFERLGFGRFRLDVSKPMNGQSSLIPLSSAAASPKLIDLQKLPGMVSFTSMYELFGYNVNVYILYNSSSS